MHIFLILLIIIGSILFAYGLNGQIKEFAFSLGLAMLITACIMIADCLIFDYKQGQIDALTGKVKYELKTNPDKTVEWVEITNQK